ncbi:CpsD/CapB family tyrosine-protein kinase [Desulfobacula toluolica]|uniref:non-specific protein-tyrosine kinase n=1 Tax=Desulfobacula toluolica (strain DSM 7467 / Tol2) TaxID=651182 RepID=K0NS47_DESTT|nr:CpsD/CapB family tyrosine-protein kinase [Desulfobacula toluolica]CCK81807.1 putative capsular exopolysaccharide family protein [Desulfobacula toluolica Tol2]
MTDTNSFAEQFMKNSSSGKKGRQKSEKYSKDFSQAAPVEKIAQTTDVQDVLINQLKPKKELRQSVVSETNEEELINEDPIFENNVVKDANKDFSAWRFLNLKNKKQTGDLYKKILFFNKKNTFKVFNFVSSRSKEGVSTILANLAYYANSQTAKKNILIIDTNLQSPKLHSIFKIPENSPGLINIFYNKTKVRQAIIQVSPCISVLTCGNIKNTPSNNIDQESFSKLIDYCKHLYDYIFIDCPPVLSSPDSLSIAPVADITFLIIQSAQVQKPVVEKTKSLLQNDECKIGGVVLNSVKQVIPGWVYKFI